MARRMSHRSKPKKRPNRYNPSAPDWAAVHGKLLPLSGLGLGGAGGLFGSFGYLAASAMRAKNRAAYAQQQAKKETS